MLFFELQNRLPKELIEKMKTTMQFPLHHAEGSVYNHSLLVSKILPEEIDFQMAAMFHDMGKITTTVYEEHKNGGVKISSKMHEIYAEKYIDTYKHLFEDLVIQWNKVKSICSQHMRAHLYLDGRMSNINKRAQFEQQIYFEDIIQFAKADSEGRMSENGMPVVIITVGIPGSGKTTWRKKFNETSYYEVICPDEIREELTGSISDQSQNGRVWKEVYSRFDSFINDKKNVIFDSTGCSIKTVNEILKHCKDKAIFVFKIFDVLSSVAKYRIRKDIENNVNRSNVPDDVVDAMRENFRGTLQYIKDSGFPVLKD